MARAVDRVLADLRRLTLRMGGRAESILEKGMRSVLERNIELASEVQEDDLAIDRLDVEVDEAVLEALALQQPVAEDLRQVLAVKMIATDLERVGDLARNIGKSAMRLSSQPESSFPPEFKELSDSAQSLLRRALNAFSELDTTLAHQVIAGDDAVDDMESVVIRKSVEKIGLHPEDAGSCVDLILIAKNLERVADHATNIAEDVVLIAEARNVKHASKLAEGNGGG